MRPTLRLPYLKRVMSLNSPVLPKAGLHVHDGDGAGLLLVELRIGLPQHRAKGRAQYNRRVVPEVPEP